MLGEVIANVRKEFLTGTRYRGWWMRCTVTPFLAMARMLFITVSLLSRGNRAAIAAYAGMDNYLAFVAIGFLLSMWVEGILWGPGWALHHEQRSGTLTSVLVTPAKPLSFFLGQSLYDMIENGIFSTLFLLATAKLAFGLSLTPNIPQFVLAMAVTASAMYGFSLIFASLIVTSKDANSVSGLMSTVFSVLSGSTYPIAILPIWLRALTWLSPLTWGINACRDALILGKPWLTSTTGVWLIVYAIALPVIGVALFKRCLDRGRQTGSIGLF